MRSVIDKLSLTSLNILESLSVVVAPLLGQSSLPF